MSQTQTLFTFTLKKEMQQNKISKTIFIHYKLIMLSLHAKQVILTGMELIVLTVQLLEMSQILVSINLILIFLLCNARLATIGTM